MLLARGSGVPAVLWYAGFPKTALTVGVGTEALRRGAPQLLLSPTGAGWLASLPRAATVAAPWADVGSGRRGGHGGGVAAARGEPGPLASVVTRHRPGRMLRA
jgi:hypothetical protein